MPDRWKAPITAGQQRVPRSETPQPLKLGQLLLGVLVRLNPAFRSWPIVWTRKWAAELRKRVIVDGQACVQGPAFPQVKAL
jgi:hypothetical protein